MFHSHGLDREFFCAACNRRMRVHGIVGMSIFGTGIVVILGIWLWLVLFTP
jgi:hypothetical protein